MFLLLCYLHKRPALYTIAVALTSSRPTNQTILENVGPSSAPERPLLKHLLCLCEEHGMGHAPWDCSCDQGEFYGKLHSTAPYIFCKVGRPQATIFNLDADKTFYNPEQQLVFSFAGCHQLLSNLSAYQHSLLVTLVSQVNLLQH